MSNLNRHPVRRTAAGVLAGMLALSGAVAAATPASALPQFAFERLDGADRYATAAEIATETFPTGSANVVLASGAERNFPDALVANYLAGRLNAPILLTATGSLPASTRAALTRLGATNVTIVGGTSAVSSAVETAVRGMSGMTVTRIGGADRYATAQLVAAATRTGTTGVGEIAGQRTAIVGTGQVAADILPAGPLAYAQQFPLVITRPGSLPSQSMAVLRDAGIQRVIIVGGETAVTSAVEAQIRAMGITNITRVSGQVRAATAVEIANFAITNLGFSTTHINLARGDVFADALAGGPHGGKEKAAILLTDPNTLSPAAAAFLQARSSTLTNGHIYGGPAAVSAAVEAAAEAAAGATAGPVALTATSVAQGGTLTGTITGDNIQSVTVSGCGFTDQTIGADDNATTAGRQFTLNVGATQATGSCNLTFTITPTGGGAATTQVVAVNVTAGATSATVRPELQTAAIVSTTTPAQANATNIEGTVVRYTFDEQVLSATATGFRLVRADGTFLDAGQVLVSASGNDVTVRFPSVNATTDTTAGGAAANVNNFTLATVELGSATDAQGQTNPEGDAAVGTASQTTTTATANTTVAPDLRSVGGFRQANPNVTADSTAIDFTFDQAAFVVNANGFNIVTLQGGVINCTGPAQNSTTASGGTIAGGNGTTTITVTCPNINGSTTITAADIARAFVATGTVADTQANANVTTTTGTTTVATPVNDNPLQSAAMSNNGRTIEADLVSAQFVARNTGTNTTSNDQVLYVFDQGVGAEVTTGVTNTAFNVFFADGDQLDNGTVTAISQDRTQVLVTFSGAALTDAVGASVNTTTTFDPASAGVTPVRTSSTSRVPGEVAAPELRSVALASTTDVFNNVSFTASYTFDQAVGVVADVTNDARFHLYMANGTRLDGQSCASPANATATNTVIVCTAFTSETASATSTNIAGGPATQAAVGSATLGTVERAAVIGQADSGNVNENPIGAEFTTGGTGTRTA